MEIVKIPRFRKITLLFKIPQTNIHKKGALKTACNKEKWKVEDYI